VGADAHAAISGGPNRLPTIATDDLPVLSIRHAFSLETSAIEDNANPERS
jgi:hypothetical protein